MVASSKGRTTGVRTRAVVRWDDNNSRCVWLLCLGLGLFACGGGDGSQDSNDGDGGETEGDATGDSADGGATGGPGGDSADAGTGDDGSDGEPGGDDGGPIDPENLVWPLLKCDPIAPDFCEFPFPSNVFTLADPESPTGRRVELPTKLYSDDDPSIWRPSDGFSPSSAILAQLPGAVSVGLSGPDDIGASVDPESKTILLNAETGELVAHFSELDLTANDRSQRALMIRPAARLEGGTRYIVAIQDVLDANAQPVAASPAFADLRDGTDLSAEDSVEKRRLLYQDIFARLELAGIERDGLQLAWDFTTATDENITGWLLHMRDETFAELGDASPAYTIDNVDESFHPEEFLFRLEGTFQAPLYMTQPGPGQPRLVFGDDGLPVSEGTVEVGWTMIVPRTAEEEPAALVQHGHGLLGGRGQIEAGTFRELATTYNYAIFAVDWIGMAGEDNVHIGLSLSNGRAGGLASMTDRLHQGTLHQLLAMRVARAGLATDPMLEGLLDPDERYYYGISQGGILGGVYMAASTEVERGVLDVLGAPYNLLLTRSVDFDVFFTIIRSRWGDPREVQWVLATTQMLWDRAEPGGWTPFIRDPLPNTPAHEVLMTAAIGDHQVTTLGGHWFARSVPGAKHLDTGIRDIWGLESVDGSHTGSAYVEYDFGLPPDPACNLPQTACDDPHGKLRNLPSAREQIDTFLTTGEIRDFCTDACSYPEQSGCEQGEGTPNVCNP